jgi:hypothetical protein
MKIYKVSNYRLENKDFEKNKLEFENIKDLIKELEENDNSYHFRIHKNTKYIFFGDIDNLNQPIDSFITMLKSFLKSRYDLELEKKDFRYTKNNVKNSSYHFSIPKWNLKVEKLKEIFQNFQDEYKVQLGNTKAIDTTIYSEHWFRCPYQSKGNGDNAIHEVVEGDTKDFIIDYIPENSMDIDDKIITKNKKKDNTIIASLKVSNNEEILVLSLPEKLDNDYDFVQGLLCCIL